MCIMKFAQFKKSGVITCFESLPKNYKRKVFLLTVIQTFLGILDLVAIALIGVISSLTITGIRSENVGPRTQRILKILAVNDLNFQKQVFFVAAISALLLILRTIVSAYLNFRIIRFLSHVSSEITSHLIEQILS